MNETPSRVRGKSRIQLDLTDRQLEAVKKVQQHIDCNSYSEVFRRALAIMEKIIELERGGKVQFGFADEHNDFHYVWFL